MNEDYIIAFMAKHEDLTLSQIAFKLGIETIDVSMCQHNRLKKVQKKIRTKSPAWALLDIVKDELRWLPKAEFEKALVRIEAGETGILEELQKEYKVSSFYKSVLLSHG